MNWKTILFGGVVVGGALLIARKFAANILYEFKGIKWLGLDGLKMRLALIYTLDNQNDIPATVSNMNAKVLYGTYELNKVEVLQAVTVQPGERKDMEVRFTVSPGTLLAEILRFFEDKAGFKKFRLKGWMSGKVGDVPFKYPLNENLELAE